MRRPKLEEATQTSTGQHGSSRGSQALLQNSECMVNHVPYNLALIPVVVVVLTSRPWCRLGGHLHMTPDTCTGYLHRHSEQTSSYCKSTRHAKWSANQALGFARLQQPCRLQRQEARDRLRAMVAH